jgi:hypothetical protein
MGGKRILVTLVDPHQTHGKFLMNAFLTQMYLCAILLEYIGFSVFRGTLKKNSQPCLPFCSWDLGCKLTSMVINIANPMMGQAFHFVAGIMEGL